MPITSDEDGELRVPGLHDASLEAIVLTGDGAEIKLRSHGSDLVAIRLLAPRVWAWSEGVVLPNIVHHAWLAQSPVLPERFAQLMGPQAIDRFLKDRDAYAGDGWVFAFNMILGGQLVLFGSGNLPEERIVALRSSA